MIDLFDYLNCFSMIEMRPVASFSMIDLFNDRSFFSMVEVRSVAQIRSPEDYRTITEDHSSLLKKLTIERPWGFHGLARPPHIDIHWHPHVFRMFSDADPRSNIFAHM